MNPSATTGSTTRGWRWLLAVYWPALAVGTHWPPFVLRVEGLENWPLDKGLHFAAYFILAALALGARLWRGQWVTAAVLVGYALLDEWTQTFVERTFDAGDLAADGVGVMVAAMAWWGLGSVRGGAKPQAAGAGSGDQHSFVGAAKVVSILTFVSRITGLLRDSYLGSAFGLGGITDAFWTGFLMPNLFRRLFGEGALTAAFIPVYTELLAKDRVMARRLASACLGLSFIVLGALTILAELLLAGLLVSREWTVDGGLAIRLTMLMLPYMPMVCLVALVGGMLQVHGKFAPAAGMPILLNVVMIAGTCVGLRMFGTDDAGLRSATYLVGVSVVVAGFVQLLTQGAMLMRYESFTRVMTDVGPALRGMLATFLPMLVALSVFQINTAMDTLIALFLSPKDGGPAQLNLLGHLVDFPVSAGGVTALNNAGRLYQFPLGVFGLAIASAIFPALSHAAATVGAEAGQRFCAIVQQGLRLTLFIGLPASVGLILIRVPITRVIYEHGKVTLDDSLLIANVLAGYAPAIWAYSMSHVITRAFYAQKDPKTPLRISVGMVALNFALNLMLVWHLGAAGLAWASAICAMLQIVLMLRALQRYVDRPVDREVWRGWLRTAALCAVMAAVLAPVVWWFDPMALSKREVLVELGAMVVLGAAVFGAGAWVMRCEELGWLRGRK